MYYTIMFGAFYFEVQGLLIYFEKAANTMLLHLKRLKFVFTKLTVLHTI